MRRRQILLERELLRQTLNTEQAVSPPEPPKEDTPQPPRKRGRPRKVKDDNAP